ncbi:tetratricopeptide repeat protein [Sinimarinibacterium thermocellulolyticum]|uniref:Tetratricopeptide repeat protein n=1 Tax=Sinimarinibacterium thermocellulolyticum TaxID=3170016 RepID=A0ABV2ABH8_9GAMM
MRTFLPSAPVLAALLLTGGCASLPSARPAPDEPAANVAAPVPAIEDAPVVGAAPETPFATAAARAQYHILAGELAASRGAPAQAAAEFAAALETVRDAELAQRATGLAVLARDEALALELAHRWLELDPDSAEPREVIAGLSLRQGDLTATLEQTRALVRGHPAGPSEGFLHVAQILMQADAERADAALSVMGQLVTEWPRLAGAHHALGVVALHFERLDLAERAIAAARQLEPGNRDHELLQVGIWVGQNRIEQADAHIAKLAAASDKPAELRLGYARLLLEKNHREAAQRQLRAILAADPVNVDAHYALGVLHFNEGEFKAAEKHLRAALSGPRMQDAALQLGRVAEALQRPEEALDHYRRVRHGPAAIEAALRSASVLARIDRMSEAQVIIGELRDRFPQLATRLDLAEGELLIDSGDAEAAFALYERALVDDPDNLDLLYGRSLAREKLGDLVGAEQDLRKILSREPDDARALNALGYMLTVHTDRLDEAETLIRRALELEPDDAAIIDSMGWLHFKRGRHEQALTLLRKAYARYPDPEVAAHLGEVLWVMGRHEEAEAIWDEALRSDADHPVVLETRQRLRP